MKQTKLRWIIDRAKFRYSLRETFKSNTIEIVTGGTVREGWLYQIAQTVTQLEPLQS